MKRPLEKLQKDHKFIVELWKFYRSFAERDTEEPGYWDDLLNQAAAFCEMNEGNKARQKFILTVLDAMEQHEMEEKRSRKTS